MHPTQIILFLLYLYAPHTEGALQWTKRSGACINSENKPQTKGTKKLFPLSKSEDDCFRLCSKHIDLREKDFNQGCECSREPDEGCSARGESEEKWCFLSKKANSKCKAKYGEPGNKPDPKESKIGRPWSKELCRESAGSMCPDSHMYAFNNSNSCCSSSMESSNSTLISSSLKCTGEIINCVQKPCRNFHGQGCQYNKGSNGESECLLHIKEVQKQKSDGESTGYCWTKQRCGQMSEGECSSGNVKLKITYIDAQYTEGMCRQKCHATASCTLFAIGKVNSTCQVWTRHDEGKQRICLNEKFGNHSVFQTNTVYHKNKCFPQPPSMQLHYNFDSNTETDYRANKHNNAKRFDGEVEVASRLSKSNHTKGVDSGAACFYSEIEFPTEEQGHGAYTVMFWLKYNCLKDNQAVFRNLDATVRCRIDKDGSSYLTVSGCTSVKISVPAGVWNMLALRFSQVKLDIAYSSNGKLHTTQCGNERQHIKSIAATKQTATATTMLFGDGNLVEVCVDEFIAYKGTRFIHVYEYFLFITEGFTSSLQLTCSFPEQVNPLNALALIHPVPEANILSKSEEDVESILRARFLEFNDFQAPSHWTYRYLAGMTFMNEILQREFGILDGKNVRGKFLNKLKLRSEMGPQLDIMSVYDLIAHACMNAFHPYSLFEPNEEEFTSISMLIENLDFNSDMMDSVAEDTYLASNGNWYTIEGSNFPYYWSTINDEFHYIKTWSQLQHVEDLSCLDKGIDYHGGDLETHNSIKSWRECMKLCHKATRDKCPYWSWQDDSVISQAFRCIFKSKAGFDNKKQKLHYVSAPRSCLSNEQANAAAAAANAITKICSFHVISIKQSSNSKGKYFSFYRSSLNNFAVDQVITIVVTNTRSKKSGKVKVWGHNNNGDIGDAHGRWNSGEKDKDWEVGDEVVINETNRCPVVLTDKSILNATLVEGSLGVCSQDAVKENYTHSYEITETYQEAYKCGFMWKDTCHHSAFYQRH